MPAIRFCLSSLWMILRCLLAAALMLGLGGQHARAMGPIQDLIDAAPPGGTVSLPAGTIAESLTIDKNLTLAGHPDGTILQPLSGQRGITLGLGADYVSISSLTIQMASVPETVSGGAIYAENSTLAIHNCNIASYYAGYGAGIFLKQGNLTVQYSTFTGNDADYDGGAIYSGGPLTLQDTYIGTNKDNVAGYGGGALEEDVDRDPRPLFGAPDLGADEMLGYTYLPYIDQ